MPKIWSNNIKTLQSSCSGELYEKIAEFEILRSELNAIAEELSVLKSTENIFEKTLAKSSVEELTALYLQHSTEFAKRFTLIRLICMNPLFLN